MDDQATIHYNHCPSTAFLPVQPYCVNARRNRCQEDLNSYALGELEEITRTPSYYVAEDLNEAIDVAQNHPFWRLMFMFVATQPTHSQ